MAQIVASLKVIMGRDGSTRGQDKIQQLKDNSNWFRRQLVDMGLEVLGDDDSPIMPFMIYQPSKIPGVSRRCLAKGLGVVVVGFPATPLLLSRARICISAAHTREDLEYAVRRIREMVQETMIGYGAAGRKGLAAKP